MLTARYCFAIPRRFATILTMFSLFRKGSTDTFPPLTLFNTETRSLETFTPLKANRVLMYSCGPTVYDYAHIGNLRAYIFVDTLKRTLLYNGYDVNNTINFTDFGHLTSDEDTGDDKMMKGLKREGLDVSLENMRLLADKYIAAFTADMDALHVLPPTQYARASDFVKEQIALIETLAEKGYTYETSDGVYFDIQKYPAYGKLGKVDLAALKAGARVAVNDEKRHPADFALWKKGDLGWESRWGRGFPGWHIECSAMAFATLGKQIDIHTGGIDHIAVHHNAEIAQCECASGKPFAHYWMHNEHLQISNEKIAKSTGNGLTLHDLSDRGYSADDFRYWLLQTHYRTPANFSFEALDAAKQGLRRLKQLVYVDWVNERGKLNTEKQQQLAALINDDLNTPKVIALMHELSKDESLAPGERRVLLLEADALLGVGLSADPVDGAAALGMLSLNDIPIAVRTMVDERQAARAAQNWAESDRLRDAIAFKGYTVTDTAQGPQITKKDSGA